MIAVVVLLLLHHTRFHLECTVSSVAAINIWSYLFWSYTLSKVPYTHSHLFIQQLVLALQRWMSS